MFIQLKKHLSLLILGYLRFWAKKQLAKNSRATIIGITGSAGKTSTRLALVKILETRGVVKHSVHANSESGIPLNILGMQMSDYSIVSWLRVVLLAPLQYLTLNEHYNFYIVEMGIDSPFPPKNMDYLLTIVKPDIAIILGASLTHTAGFDQLVKDNDPKRRSTKLLTLIAQEKMKLAQSLPPKGVAIINDDNAVVANLSNNLKCRTIRFGKNNNCDLKISSINPSSSGFRTKFSYQNNSALLSLPDIYEPEYASTFAAASAAGLSLGISLNKCLAALSAYRAPAGRMRVFEGQNESHLIDSSYNASPATLSSSLTLLSQIAHKNYKIAVIGDMRELGSASKLSHQALAAQIMQNADEAILFGKETLKYTLPLLRQSNFPVHHFLNMQDLIKFLAKAIRSQSWVLFKGSQNEIFLERAVEAMLKNRSDQFLLCRRGAYWDKLRALTS